MVRAGARGAVDCPVEAACDVMRSARAWPRTPSSAVRRPPSGRPSSTAVTLAPSTYGNGGVLADAPPSPGVRQMMLIRRLVDAPATESRN